MALVNADYKVSKDEVTRKVTEFNRNIYTRSVVVLFKQHHRNPKNGLIALCHEESVPEAEDKLQTLGYTLEHDDFHTKPFKLRNRQQVKIEFDSDSNVQFMLNESMLLTFSMDTEIYLANFKIIPKTKNIKEKMSGTLVVTKLGEMYALKDTRFEMLVDLVSRLNEFNFVFVL